MAENMNFAVKNKINSKATKGSTKSKKKETTEMAENMNFAVKNGINSKATKGSTNKSNKKEEKVNSKRLKQMMKKRLIIRNLSFKVSEEKLKDIFSKFGEVLDVTIPLNKDGLKRGFAFIRYKEAQSLIKAMKMMNFQKIEGRPIAIDYAVPKTKYQILQQNKRSESSIPLNDAASDKRQLEKESHDIEGIKQEIKSESDSDEDSMNDKHDDSNDDGDDNNEEKRVKIFFKEFDEGKDVDENSSEDSSDEDTDNEKMSEHLDNNASDSKPQTQKKSYPEDVLEKKTVFIRNVSFKSTEEDLQEVVEEFGGIQYCLLCFDPVTDHPKGSAFVKFKEKESAEKLIQESLKEPGIMLDGRKLLCTYAVSRGELSKKDNDSNKNKDKRNLRLLKCGLIVRGSKEAEGVSHADMAKRFQLEVAKKQKLRNVNFFVSDNRLIIHNLPKHIKDRNLHSMFQEAAGKEALIKEARVMRDLKKTDAKGVPVSKGFGFVSFAEHEHALKALMALNNNPNIFSFDKRPIVEFSIENKVALLTQERRREKMKMLSRKRKEENIAKQQDEMESSKELPLPSQTPSMSSKKRKNKVNKILPFKKQQKTEFPSSETKKKNSSKRKEKKQLQKSRKGTVINAQDRENLSSLTSKYKAKLLNFPQQFYGPSIFAVTLIRYCLEWHVVIFSNIRTFQYHPFKTEKPILESPPSSSSSHPSQNHPYKTKKKKKNSICCT